MFWTDITVTVSGQETKLANCDYCGEQYAYVAQVTTSSRAHAMFMLFQSAAAERARRDAAAQLDQKLATAVDAVPCLNCARFPTSIAHWIRKNRFKWMWNLGLGVTLIPTGLLGIFIATSVILAADGKQLNLTIGLAEVLAGFATFVPGFGILLVRKLLVAGYDPNAERSLEKRRRIARGRAWSLSPPIELQHARR